MSLSFGPLAEARQDAPQAPAPQVAAETRQAAAAAHPAVKALALARAAAELSRMARAAELYERALAAAEADAALPRGSMLLVWSLEELSSAIVANSQMLTQRAAEGAGDAQAALAAAWRDSPRALALSQRALALLLGRFSRWRCCLVAGTLWAPLTPLERDAVPNGSEWEANDTDALLLTPPRERAAILFAVAGDAVKFWPALSDAAAEEARLRGVSGALRALLAMSDLGVWHEGRRQRGLNLGRDSYTTLFALMLDVLGGNTGQTSVILIKLRALGLLTDDEEATLRTLIPSFAQAVVAVHSRNTDALQQQIRRAAEDVALHGLRTCALPRCGATEAQPKTFKVCSLCQRVAYCGKEHQREDWRRHKHNDCLPPAA
jgi:hypothetical protein